MQDTFFYCTFVILIVKLLFYCRVMINFCFENILLSTAYLPNIQYFTKLIHAKEAIIDPYENYVKQSYRNRCDILSANGPLSLSIPIERSKGKFTVKEAIIDYSQNWQIIHWRAIIAAYRSSPFFEYYTDDFFPFFEQKEKYLIDFNYGLLETTYNLLGLNKNFVLSHSYCESHEFDYRNKISPKITSSSDAEFIPTSYYQVFLNKYPFISNLSIIDLLCNEGNNSLSILLDSLQ